MTMPRLVLGGWRAAQHDPGAIVIDVRDRTIHGLRLRARPRPSRFRLMVALLVRANSFLSISELIDVVWGDHADGGPEDAAGSLRAMLYRSAEDFQRDGRWTILNWNGFGYGLWDEIRAFLKLPAEARKAVLSWGETIAESQILANASGEGPAA